MTNSPVRAILGMDGRPAAPSRDQSPDVRLQYRHNTPKSARATILHGRLNRKPFVIDQWRQVGVTVQQEIPDAATYFQRRTSGNFDVTNTGMPDIIDDPYLQLSMFPSASHNTGNLAFYDDAKVDELYQKQASLMNFDDRRKIVRGRPISEPLLIVPGLSLRGEQAP